MAASQFVAATRRPWYLRVLHPLTVLEANPPSPFVSSYPRRSAASRLVQIYSPDRIMTRVPMHGALVREKVKMESCFLPHLRAKQWGHGKSGTARDLL